jgi:hypothetical protein
MAEDLQTIFADSVAKAEAASDIAYLWANGDETTVIQTDSGELPSLAKFQFDNVGAGSFSEFEVDLSSGNAVITSQDWVENSFFKASGHSVERTVTLPPNPKLAYFQNAGSAPVTLILGTTEVLVAPNLTFVVYTDGTSNGLLNVTSHTKIDTITNTNPTASDDESEGYVYGSTWYNTSSGLVYFLVDNTEGAAIWVDITGESASTILTKIKTVDGAGSGLDADLLDGIDSSEFLQKSQNETITGLLTIGNNSGDDSVLDFTDVANSTFRSILWANADGEWQVEAADGLLYTLWHSGNDGAGSGLDADTVDGLQGSEIVNQDSDTGAASLPTGDISQRPNTPVEGMFRYNNETTSFEGYSNGDWAGVGGASGGADNPFVYENDATVTADYEITSGKNAMSAGPITIADGATVTIPDGSVWTIV